MSSNTPNIAIYAAGGCGVNIVKVLEQQAKLDDKDSLDQLTSWFETYYIDTSVSNMRTSSIDRDRVYLFENVDGSGGERAENHPEILKLTPTILQKFKPKKFNIIVSSAGGGSGAVINGCLTSELLKRKENVISIVVGSVDSLKQIDNTIKTLKSFDGIANARNRPAVVYYLENEYGKARKDTDTQATSALCALITLLSGYNDELDSADLRKWLDHPSLRNELVTLHFAASDEAYKKLTDVGTVATLAKPEDNTTLDPVPPYQAVGFFPSGQSAVVSPLHFVITKNSISSITRRLEQLRATVNELLLSSARRESLISDDDAVDDSGMVI